MRCLAASIRNVVEILSMSVPSECKKTLVQVLLYNHAHIRRGVEAGWGPAGYCKRLPHVSLERALLKKVLIEHPFHVLPTSTRCLNVTEVGITLASAVLTAELALAGRAA